jgi:hypothetical protein
MDSVRLLLPYETGDIQQEQLRPPFPFDDLLFQGLYRGNYSNVEKCAAGQNRQQKKGEYQSELNQGISLLKKYRLYLPPRPEAWLSILQRP